MLFGSWIQKASLDSETHMGWLKFPFWKYGYMSWILSTFIEILWWPTFVILALGETGRSLGLAGHQPRMEFPANERPVSKEVDFIPGDDVV